MWLRFVVVLLLVSPVAHGDELVPRRQRARNELIGGLSLLGASVGLAVLGGALAGSASGVTPDGPQRGLGGFAISMIGVGLFLPALEVITYGAGHRTGLRRISVPETADDATRAALLQRIEEADRGAGSQEIWGIGLVGAGAALVATGLMVGLIPRDDRGYPVGSTAVLGAIIGILGAPLLVAGSFVWPHAAGLRRGLRESREAALRLTPTGLAGTW